MSKLVKMFFPSRRTSDLGGNGGCGGMVSILLIGVALGLLATATHAFGAEQWKPRIIIAEKNGNLTLLQHRDFFETKAECDLFLSAKADEIKTMIDNALGDRLEKYDAKCVQVVEERDS